MIKQHAHDQCSFNNLTLPDDGPPDTATISGAAFWDMLWRGNVFVPNDFLRGFRAKKSTKMRSEQGTTTAAHATCKQTQRMLTRPYECTHFFVVRMASSLASSMDILRSRIASNFASTGSNTGTLALRSGNSENDSSRFTSWRI